ncbi:hypothetical protein LCGC14_0816110 [marine sediment metagenome]|uniref:DUF86 domain-containing protein n=1 Tax=marine sediment metagenome TaxID=412755 RepID=A0A0F9SSM9_9ZZZZ
MKERTPKIYLEDIITFIKRIESYIQDLNFENFKKTQLVIDAVIRNLELIGEASKNISSEIKKKFSNIPWSEMIGLRNLATHGYFKIDLKIIWDIITKDIPENKQSIQNIYNGMFKESEENNKG